MWSRISALFFSPLVYAESQSAYDFHVKDIKGEPVHLLTYRKSPVWLVVNVASACGYADQNYKELQTLYTKYQDQGLVILAFPCNQFNSQESKSNEEILSFVQKRYGVTFPLFEKILVNGPNADPFFKFLTKKQSGFITDDIKWNFTKFLIVQGVPVKRYGTSTRPLDIDSDIQEALANAATIHNDL